MSDSEILDEHYDLFLFKSCWSTVRKHTLLNKYSPSELAEIKAIADEIIRITREEAA